MRCLLMSHGSEKNIAFVYLSQLKHKQWDCFIILNCILFEYQRQLKQNEAKRSKSSQQKTLQGEEQLDITTADVPPTPGDAYAYVTNNNSIKASILQETPETLQITLAGTYTNVSRTPGCEAGMSRHPPRACRSYHVPGDFIFKFHSHFCLLWKCASFDKPSDSMSAV